ncbi:UNKNOWN [Stylonychia lemnae]|uniref:Uncharacterized protein n=1 Tax=Stylonychia lemnae TaxID=5949 RepID=A0A078AUP1_STYLE|nr:UNKNOWN [Stylonychia lemnae]|eukprot:CDW86120.1 UNKNOWN [Stylonychia lemnae]
MLTNIDIIVCCYNFISCALSLPFILLSSSFSSYEQSGLFPLILIDISVRMFENINGKTNLYFGMLENQYTIPLMYIGALFFMDEKLISILSIAVVSYMIAKGLYLTHLLIPNDRLKVIEQKVDPAFSKFPTEINVAQNTDDLASFDRRQLRGRVSQPGNGYDSYNSTQASSSFNSIGGGIMLGGLRERDDSVLRSQDTSLALIMSTERSSNESENDQNEERKLNSESDEYAV